MKKVELFLPQRLVLIVSSGESISCWFGCNANKCSSTTRRWI